MPETPDLTISQGSAGTDETATFTFKAMKAGQSITIAGLTIEAKLDVTALKVAEAFAGKRWDDTYPIAMPDGLAFSGRLTEWASVDTTNATVIFTARDTDVNATDITMTLDSSIESDLLKGSKGKFSGILSGFSTGPTNGSMKGLVLKRVPRPLYPQDEATWSPA